MDFSGVTWVEGGVNTPRPPDTDMDLMPGSKIDLTIAPPGA